MQTFNIHDAKTNFSKLVDSAAGGEEIIIAKAGKPAARLVPLRLMTADEHFAKYTELVMIVQKSRQK